MGAVLAQQCPEDRAVTPRLVGAVASNGEFRALRQGGQKNEEPRGRRALHLGTVAPDEPLPFSLLPSTAHELDQLLGRGELRQPDVIEITRSVVGPGDSAWR